MRHYRECPPYGTAWHLLTIGMVTELFIESNNDNFNYLYIADQQTMDEF